MASQTDDIVIIGGGTACLILADRLSENASLQVLVIESAQVARTARYDAFDQALRKACTLHKASGAKEGDVPLQVRVSGPTTPLQKAWVDGLECIGFPRSDPFSARACGAVIAPESIDPATRQRSDATNAYLDCVRSRANLTVLTETTVTKDGKDAVAKGVQYTTKDENSQAVNARKEVIISAGAITPTSTIKAPL
ncbi:hypothetical protein Daus18300_013362 [Diaporthe australafricana]|uniref:Glucose-methanol-choline oxidoreductase N-terminal domain-containing protein n=1 Tax=Diaporthe australafricana TaxID=127596 RepID=A0ABR3VZA8_9PEZI